MVDWPDERSPNADAILDAAEELFAARGFERTTIKDIAGKAGVNSALLYYYFDDKPNLYRVVLSRLVLGLRKQARLAIGEARSIESMLKGVVEAQAQMLKHHPRAATLLLREMMDHNASHASAVIQDLAADLFKPVVAALEAGQRAGAVRADLDPRFAAISTIGQLAYFMLAKPAIQIFLGRTGPFPDANDIAAFARHAGTFAAGAVTAATGTRTRKDRTR